MPKSRPKIQEDVEDKARIINGMESKPGDFVGFVFPWESEGTPLEHESGPDKWQVDVLDTIANDIISGKESCRVAVASGHGIGKTALISWLILWFMSTRPNPQIVVTAGTESQLKTKTWRELSKWHKLAVNKDWFHWTATKFYQVDNEETWFAAAIPWSANNPDAFQGTHEERGTLIIYDEGSAIDDTIWSATEGAMTTTGAIWVAFGNPVRNTGRFKECFNRYKHRWNCFQIDSRESKKANKTQIQEWVDDHGEDSDWVRIRVRGVFPRSGLTEFIPSDLVEQAMNFKVDERVIRDQPVTMGVDVARLGDDQSVITYRRGRQVLPQEKFRIGNLMELSSVIAARVGQHDPFLVFIDEGGLGAGVLDRVRQLCDPSKIIGVNSAHRPTDIVAYANKRVEMWGRMRDWLRGEVELPNDNELLTDLVGPMYSYNKREQLLLEKKEDMKRRGMASPDCADSLALTFSEQTIYSNPYFDEEDYPYNQRSIKRVGRNSVGGY